MFIKTKIFEFEEWCRSKFKYFINGRYFSSTLNLELDKGLTRDEVWDLWLDETLDA